jgi:hypothetical protein
LVRYSTKDRQHTNTEAMKRLASILLLGTYLVSCSAPDNNSVTSGEQNSKEAISKMTTAPIAGIREIQTTTSTAAMVAQRQAAQEEAQVSHSGSAAASDQTVTTDGKKPRKKLNNTAKGIIIGLGAGAITGAAVDKKNRGKGAVIGAAVGAAAGGATGAVLDKKKKDQEQK